MGSQNLKSKINEVLRCNYFYEITLVLVVSALYTIFVFFRKLTRPNQNNIESMYIVDIDMLRRRKTSRLSIDVIKI